MIILITGTSSGIGHSLATHFLARGHQVAGCSRKPTTIDHPDYRHFMADISDVREVRSLCRAVRLEYGYLDALINNAGTATMNHFMMTPDAVTRNIFDVNFFGVLNCCREAAKLLRKSPEPAPAILNVSTVAVPWALAGQLVYSASKAAVDQLTRVMSKELAEFNIRVNGIGLPPVRTVLTRTVASEKIDELVGRQAIKRMCTIDDVVGPVEFLVSPAAGFVTGETLFLGGVN
ncbi:MULTISPECIES: SDR family NAD(P)-dependent oxidoreductase [unclassified Frankia]|uniref:SDR family NAD(P)-dependent oxidoreductase n=1 Tax=unclassified Frankia TaxID=2632575 RepID=UPI001EF5D79F|nr:MULTISPECIES: SDR family oxidoreductase [unclassified Frankia]